MSQNAKISTFSTKCSIAGSQSQYHLNHAGMWKRLNFCGSGSTLKKEAGSRSKLESIWLFEEAEPFFIKHGAGMWKRKWWKRFNFVEAEVKAFWRKKLEAKAYSEASHFIRSWNRKQNIFYCFHMLGLNSSTLHVKFKLYRQIVSPTYGIIRGNLHIKLKPHNILRRYPWWSRNWGFNFMWRVCWRAPRPAHRSVFPNTLPMLHHYKLQ